MAVGRCGTGRALLTVAALQLAGVALVGLLARDLAARRPAREAHLIDQLSQAAKSCELDGAAVYPPGDARRHTIFGGADARHRACDCEWAGFVTLPSVGSGGQRVDRWPLPNRQ